MIKYGDQDFDSIKHINAYGQEYWYARKLQIVLDYSQWRRFHDVIGKAIDACRTSGNNVSDYFAEVGKMVDIGSASKRACWLNGGDMLELVRYERQAAESGRNRIRGTEQRRNTEIREELAWPGGEINPHD